MQEPTLFNYQMALLITFFAGLATLIGGCFTFIIKKDNIKALSIGLGFSAGVMIFLSLTEVLQTSEAMLLNFFPNKASWMVFFGFIFGVVVALLIDYFLPDHIDGDIFLQDNSECHRRHKIKRAGVMTAIAIAIHNFPEGIATFFVASQDLTLGIPIAVAIGLHNIPEGIAVALPIYHATGKKRLAILYSCLAGISEPIGALVGLFVLHAFLPQVATGFLFAAVAGIMIYISFDTILPLSRDYGDGHYSVFGIMSGVLFIWLSLLLLG